MQSSTTRTRPIAMLVAAALLLLAFNACGGSDDSKDTGAAGGGDSSAASSESPAGGGSDIEVIATEYAFSIPQALPAGETNFTLKNTGDEPHMLIVAELTDDAPPVEKLIKMDEKKSDKFIVEQQVIEPIDPGTTSEEPITMDLKAGATYGYVCFVPSPKKSEGHGQPHAFLGMYGTFTVQ